MNDRDGTRITLAQVRGFIDAWFTQDRGSQVPMSREDDGREILPGVLFQFVMRNLAEDQRRLRMQVYCGLGEVGGELWEQEARALLRISKLRHPALPQVCEGGYNDEALGGVGFVLSDLQDIDLSWNDDVRGNGMAFIHQSGQVASHLHPLVDALFQLHGRGIVHRNVWPGAIEVKTGPNNELQNLRLARFEMSMFIANLARRTRGGDHVAMIRSLYRRQGAQALLCCPPERLALLYQRRDHDSYEDHRGDIYGLGMMACQWIIGPVDARRVDAIFAADEDYDADGLKRLRGDMLAALRDHPDASGTLKRVVENMMMYARRPRWTAGEVLKELKDSKWARARVESPPARPLLVSIAPEHFRGTLHHWGYLETNPATKQGWSEVSTFIATDIREGLLLYSKDGFLGFSSQTGDELKAAKYILLGRAVAYFASELRRADSPFRPNDRRRVPEVLHICYTCDLRSRKARYLERKQEWVRLPELEVVHYEAIDDGTLRGRAPWTPYLDRVKCDETVPEWQPDFAEALRFLLEVEEVRLEVRRYPFQCVSRTGRKARLTLDADEDQKYIYGTALRRHYASWKDGRPPFGDFFEGLDSATQASVEFYAAQEQRYGERKSRGRGFIERKLSKHEIEIELASGPFVVPDRGWICPAEDLGSRVALARQRVAVEELLANEELLEQLHRPQARLRLRPRPRPDPEQPEPTWERILREVTSYYPFYAIHGPPGSGKTTLAANAVEAVLQRDRSQRILVTAQSHFSLDNIGERIVQKCKDISVLPIRIASQSGDMEDKVTTDEMRKHVPQRLVAKLIDDIKSVAERRRHTGYHEENPSIQRIMREWAEHAPASGLELKERIWRGANIVFTTCLTATEQLLSPGNQDVCDLFDWVIVEEAAKASPTELAVPLVRGVQWTLIGDHMQLPGFGTDAIKDLLDSFEGNSEQSLTEHYEARDAYLRVIDMFGNFFEDPNGPAQRDETTPIGQLSRPVGRLDMQYRMHPTIGDLVANFYKQGLESGPKTREDHGITSLDPLVGRSLVWCDTHLLEDCGDSIGSDQAPGWHNEVEVRLIQRLVERMGEGVEVRLVVLSPYRAQCHRLRMALGALGDRVFTVDSFQGKEADIVIVSLVRDNQRTSIRGKLGHLADPRRTNVMLSRARRLLILVGNFAHFRTAGEATWASVCKYASELGAVIPAAEFVPLARRSPTDDEEGGDAP